MPTIPMQGFRCARCGHTWTPNDIKKPPKQCPKCRSPYWTRERRRKP